MARRPGDSVTLTCPLDEVEQDFAAEMMRACGIELQCNLVRLGLYHLAKHLDLPIGNQVFGERRTRRAVGYRGAPSRLEARQLRLEEIAPCD